MNRDLTQWLASNEEYSEGVDSTFTHNGQTWRVDDLLAAVKNQPVIMIETNKLTWMIDDNYDNKRVQAANTSIPIIVNQLPTGEWVTCDGYHRLIKAAWYEKKNTIPAKIVTDQMLTKLPKVK